MSRVCLVKSYQGHASSYSSLLQPEIRLFHHQFPVPAAFCLSDLGQVTLYLFTSFLSLD